MEAKELRIGNLVEDELLGKVTIESILKTGQVEVSAFKLISEQITKVFYMFNISELKPIPITEEILLKCGFKFINGYGYKRHNFQLICINVADSKEFIFRYFMLNVELQYLHQLQNLYFVLTGKELEVNL